MPPSPNVHDQLVGQPELASVKLTVRGALPEVVEAENADVGTGVLTVIVFVVYEPPFMVSFGL